MVTNINKSLKKAFVDHGISQMEICHKLKISPSQLSMIVNGWRQPSTAIRQALLEIFPEISFD